MSFYDFRFPSDISFKASGGFEFKTDITTLSSGYEKRNINWQSARAKYELNYSEISKIQANKIMSFFLACKGKAIGFRFKDWNDFEAKNQTIAIADGLKKTFQLIKNYGEENFVYKRKITKPVENSLLIFVNNAHITNGVNVDYTSGIITFDEAVANSAIISASYEFDVPVRFNSDVISNDFENYNKNSFKKIELIEIKS
jgi:uncharacterized protein (TIGR02217 family)